MSHKVDLVGVEKWMCACCKCALEIRKVSVGYMGSKVPVDLPVCPKCGQVYVPEALATGKMAEVEKTLEDK